MAVPDIARTHLTAVAMGHCCGNRRRGAFQHIVRDNLWCLALKAVGLETLRNPEGSCSPCIISSKFWHGLVQRVLYRVLTRSNGLLHERWQPARVAAFITLCSVLGSPCIYEWPKDSSADVRNLLLECRLLPPDGSAGSLETARGAMTHGRKHWFLLTPHCFVLVDQEINGPSDTDKCNQ